MASCARALALALAVRAAAAQGACPSEEGVSLLQAARPRASVAQAAAEPEPRRGVAPLRAQDLEHLRLLNSSAGAAARREAWRKMAAAAPEHWAGPERRPGEVWGGPPPEFMSRDFAVKAFPVAEAAQHLNFAGPGSSIPEDLWGIWWMDQAGFSSVAQHPDYPFAVPKTADLLASFGPEVVIDGVSWGARYEERSRCVTPIEQYGGPQWAAQATDAGMDALRFHSTIRSTMSYCYSGDGNDTIQLYQKVDLDSLKVGPIPIGATIGSLLGFVGAGHGQAWVPHSLVDMKLVRQPWGWDQVTTVADGVLGLDPLEEVVLSLILPSGIWDLVSMVKATGLATSSHFPLLQVVDGEGKKTEHFDSFLAFMQTLPGMNDKAFYSLPLTT